MDFRVLIVSFLPLCSAEPDESRLVGGASRCEGHLEVKKLGLDWTPVYSGDMHLNLANRLCSELDCGSALSIRLKEAFGEQLWEILQDCEESLLNDCLYFVALPILGFLELRCSESVRLVHGPRRCSGSLEVYWDRSWTSVCEEDFDLQDAEVVCRELGCGAPSLLQRALYEKGQTFHCEGHESTLMECPRSSSPGNTCSSVRAVNLICLDHAGVRLVGWPSRCAGTVEFNLQNEWKRLFYHGDWDQTTAAVVCRELNCGSVVSGEKREATRGSVWPISVVCVKKKSALGECVSQKDTNSSVGLHVVCSDVLTRPNISLSVDGVFEAQPQGLRVLLGSNFRVTCSIDPQYPRGFFQLISPTVDPAQNHNLTAVKGSAHFLFSDAGHTHKGGYTCVYHLHVFNKDFSSQSNTLYITLGVADLDLITRVLVILLLKIIYILAFYFYCKLTRRQQPTQQRHS